MGLSAIQKLIETMDASIPEPIPLEAQPFLMPVEDVFSVQYRGTVVTGRIERGVIHVGDEIEIVGIRDTQVTPCTGVEMYRRVLDQGRAGENVELYLQGIKRDNIERGQVLAVPRAIAWYFQWFIRGVKRSLSRLP